MVIVHGQATTTTTMSWLSGGGRKTRNLFRHHHDKSPPLTLGILSFEAAKTMSRLISMYASLTDDEFSNLREGAIKSRGVTFLNSDDETFLLHVACDEKIEDLNRAVGTVCRLSQKCHDEALVRFNQVYDEMNLGILDLSDIGFDTKDVLKLVDKMEKYVNATSNLHAVMGSVSELEISERKIKQWKQNIGPKLSNRTNVDYFNEKIAFQRKQVKYYRDISLWNQTFDQAVGLMARIVCIIYARICVVFGPFVPGLPNLSNNVKANHFHQKIIRIRLHPVDTTYCLIQGRDEYRRCVSKSGPILQPSRKMGGPSPSRITKSGPLTKSEGAGIGTGMVNWSPLYIGKCKRAHQLATESTVGSAGLATRYANLITQAECYLHAPTNINEEARVHMYELLPENLKATVRGKLWGHWCARLGVEEESDGCSSLAEGWRDALEELMTWLGPVAHDTLKWQQERNLEKQRFDVKPTVSLFQTLYFSDLEKTEAAIAEVLVGLSCIYRYENKRTARSRAGSV
ncbi:hypothetical protein LWI28_010423 [Acer negundo]|uniref:Uncharacterized protein n=1 Tax=Acer negundo TaxID=4023 RepID=A0AAD5I6B5_ACENE|nr:hypothetical protein LWI28_010423 [Acer negundo]KAK4834587.1 hypothetical protein QYF36_025203 [Acer negundo]